MRFWSESTTSRLASRWQGLDKGQLVKWTVYSLLLLNWGYYAVEEFYISSHVLRQGGSFLQWTEEFATRTELSHITPRGSDIAVIRRKTR